MELLIGKVGLLPGRIDAGRELALELLIVELVSARVKVLLLTINLRLLLFLWGQFLLSRTLLNRHARSVMSGHWLLGWVGIQPFLSFFQAPLCEVDCEAGRFLARFDFYYLNGLFITLISHALDIAISCLVSAILLETVGAVAYPDIDGQVSIE